MTERGVVLGMPLYTFKCDKCDIYLDDWMGLSEVKKVTCPECKGEMWKIITAPNVSFKGPGFYSTDK